MWRFPLPTRPRAGSGTSSDTSNSSRRAARSRSSIAPGTTGPASSASCSSRPTPKWRDSSSRWCPSSSSSSTTASISSRSGSRSDARSRRNGCSARREDPLKQWKLSPLDERAPSLWEDYTLAALELFRRTDTPRTPWWFVNNNNKRVGRLNVVQHVLSLLPYDGQGRSGGWQRSAGHRGAGPGASPGNRARGLNRCQSLVVESVRSSEDA